MKQKHFIKIILVCLICCLSVGDFLIIQTPAHAAVLRVAEAQVQSIVPQWPAYDFFVDTSFQKYLSADTPFLDVEYAPLDLAAIDSAFTANNSKTFQLRQEAAIQFADMAWHFRNDFQGDKLWISSAYRSNDFQEYMLKK